MRPWRTVQLVAKGLALAWLLPADVSAAQEAKKLNILFIMGDDIGWMRPRSTIAA